MTPPRRDRLRLPTAPGRVRAAAARRWLLAGAGVTLGALALGGCGASPRNPQEAALARDTRRIGVSAMGGIFVRTPGGVGEGGGGVAVARPVWFGEQHDFAQVDVTARAQLGVTGGPRVHPAVALTAGLHLNITRYFSFEIHLGPMAGAQLGGDGVVPRAGLQGGGSYVFHLSDDHRERVEFGFEFAPGVAFARDPGNDCPMCPGYTVLRLGYVTPL